MHLGNRRWLSTLKAALPAFFVNASVLEIGAYNVNGSAREYFDRPRSYVGVDRMAGPGVDVVADAARVEFERAGMFDTLVCLSVFEHDPNWKQVFEHNVQWVRPGGLLIVGWGAEGNLRHPPEPWAVVPADQVLRVAAALPIRILDAFFEEAGFGKDTPGAFDLLAVKV